MLAGPYTQWCAFFRACVCECVCVRVCAEGETARRHACDGNPCVSASIRCTSHPGIWKDKPPQHIKVDGYPLPSGPFVRLLHKAIWTGSHPLHYYMHLCIERPLHPLLLPGLSDSVARLKGTRINASGPEKERGSERARERERRERGERLPARLWFLRDAGGGPFQHPLNITYQMLKSQSRPLACPLHCK